MTKRQAELMAECSRLRSQQLELEQKRIDVQSKLDEFKAKHRQLTESITKTQRQLQEALDEALTGLTGLPILDAIHRAEAKRNAEAEEAAAALDCDQLHPPAKTKKPKRETQTAKGETRAAEDESPMMKLFEMNFVPPRPGGWTEETAKGAVLLMEQYEESSGVECIPVFCPRCKSLYDAKIDNHCPGCECPTQYGPSVFISQLAQEEMVALGNEPKRGRGRPPGAKNKAKADPPTAASSPNGPDTQSFRAAPAAGWSLPQLIGAAGSLRCKVDDLNICDNCQTAQHWERLDCGTCGKTAFTGGRVYKEERWKAKPKHTKATAAAPPPG